MCDFDKGYQANLSGLTMDYTKSEEWQLGWKACHDEDDFDYDDEDQYV